MALAVNNPPANAGDIKDVGSIPGSGRFPGGGHGNPLQYSCLVNPMDRGAWWATVHRVAKSWTWLKRLTMHAYFYVFINMWIWRITNTMMYSINTRLQKLQLIMVLLVSWIRYSSTSFASRLENNVQTKSFLFGHCCFVLGFVGRLIVPPPTPFCVFPYPLPTVQHWFLGHALHIYSDD